MTTWIVQTNLIRYDQVSLFGEALYTTGVKYQDVAVIPFSDDPLEIDCDDPVLIPYGSTKLIKIAHSEKWKGCFFDDVTFRVDMWNANHPYMMNNDSHIMTIREAYSFMNKNYRDMWFIRPVNDLKVFSGNIISGEEFTTWVQTASYGGYTFNDTQEITIATPKNIQAEWRYFIVDGKIVDGSMYRFNGTARCMHEDDTNVLLEAQKLADIWLPSPVCVMDIALVDNEFKVLEFNCFNASGFYDHHLPIIIKEMTNYCEDIYE